MQVEMKHNPYQGSLQILVNGQSRNRLTGYANKPFSAWYHDIFNLLDGETNEDYSLTLTAGKSETALITALSHNSKYCKKITFKDFDVNTSIENRIRNLEKIRHQSVMVRFCVLPSLRNKISNDAINQILRKSFCNNGAWSLQPEYCNTGQLSGNQSECEYLFIVAEKQNELTLPLLSSARRGYYSNIFGIITDGADNVSFMGNILTLHCALLKFQDTLEKMLTCTIIGDCFWNIYQNLSETEKKAIVFQIKERPHIKIPAFIEVGRKSEIVVQLSSGTPPDVEIVVRNPALIKVTEKTLTGVVAGVTNVQVFEKGTYQLLASSDIEVRLVPRISVLFASDVGLRHGETLTLAMHDSITIPFGYAPEDASDISDVRWSSSNTAIARVHSLSGRITAMHPGTCEIKCFINNIVYIGFSIPVEVIPIPERIELPELYRNELVLNLGESYTFRPVIIPENARYDNISIQIMDKNIAILTDPLTLQTCQEGDTKVIITESPHNTSISVNLKVIAVQKKKGLLSRFFGEK